MSDWVACSCCGNDIPDVPEYNSEYIHPESDEIRTSEIGMGMCVPCGGVHGKGEDTFEVYATMTDEEIWKRRGWAEETFYKSRFDIVRNALKDKNKPKWDKWLTWEKVLFVQEQIQKGNMI